MIISNPLGGFNAIIRGYGQSRWFRSLARFNSVARVDALYSDIDTLEAVYDPTNHVEALYEPTESLEATFNHD